MCVEMAENEAVEAPPVDAELREAPKPGASALRVAALRVMVHVRIRLQHKSNPGNPAMCTIPTRRGQHSMRRPDLETVEVGRPPILPLSYALAQDGSAHDP